MNNPKVNNFGAKKIKDDWGLPDDWANNGFNAALYIPQLEDFYFFKGKEMRPINNRGIVQVFPIKPISKWFKGCD